MAKLSLSHCRHRVSLTQDGRGSKPRRLRPRLGPGRRTRLALLVVGSLVPSLGNVVWADSYLEFTVTARTRGRVVADYVHNIWIAGERARVDQSNGITWIIRDDLKRIYRLDHRDRYISAVPWQTGSALSRMAGCLWTAEGETQTRKVSQWECQERTYGCAGLDVQSLIPPPRSKGRAAQGEGSPSPEPPAAEGLRAALAPPGSVSAGDRRLEQRLGEEKAVVCMTAEIPVQVERLWSLIGRFDPWDSIAALWRTLPEPRSFPVRIESASPPISVTTVLVKAEEVEVGPQFYDPPSDYRSTSSEVPGAATGSKPDAQR